MLDFFQPTLLPLPPSSPQVFPSNLLPALYEVPDNPGHFLARSEVECRTNYIEALHRQLGEEHTLVQLVYRCLQNNPARRPSAEKLLQQLEAVRPQGAYSNYSMEMEIAKLQVTMVNILSMETKVREKALNICDCIQHLIIQSFFHRTEIFNSSRKMTNSSDKARNLERKILNLAGNRESYKH